MRRRTIILSISSLAAVVLTTAAVLATGPGGAVAHGRWGGHGGQGGWSGGGHGGKALCSEQRDLRLSAATLFVEAFVGFTPEQTQSWNALKTALEAGSAKIAEACDSAEVEVAPKSAPQHLARAELALDTGLIILRDVRPAFEDLYFKLSDEQRARIDDLLAKRGHHRN